MVRAAVLADLEDADNELPMALRDTLASLLDQIVVAERTLADMEKRLQAFAGCDLRSRLNDRMGSPMSPHHSASLNGADSWYVKMMLDNIYRPK